MRRIQSDIGCVAESNLVRRKARTVIAAFAISVTAFTSACVSEADNEAEDGVFTLVMGDSFSLTHPMGVGGTEQFVEGIKANGEEVGLAVDYYSSGQLGKQWDMPTIVRRGVADISVISPSYVASQMPLSSVGDLAGLSDDACVSAYALQDLITEGGILYEEEFKPLNLHPLWIGVIPRYEAMTADREINVPADLAGTVQRSTGGAQDRIVDAVGAAGVGMPIGDLYEAMTRGTVEGTVASPTSITPYGLEEVIGYSTTGANLGSFTSVYVMNEDTWRSLSADQQDLINELSAASQENLCAELNESVDRSLEEMRKADVKLIDVSKDADKWEALLEPTRNKWVQDLESVGKPAGKVLKEYEAALARNEHRSQKESK
ncbi:TRAP transporter substrate-binding protein [Corynebacterium sp. H113]|uniref:TRAP transporter substrate-binding protein n=1 Tax=Corynebacterium sp. H113 TaxID=3133419 RepID=UPI0030964DE7